MSSPLSLSTFNSAVAHRGPSPPRRHRERGRQTIEQVNRPRSMRLMRCVRRRCVAVGSVVMRCRVRSTIEHQPLPSRLNGREEEEEEEETRLMGEILTWLLFFFILIALVVVVVYQLMCLADLELDYINPYDSASRINFVILPEFITHGVLCLIYLLTGHWMMFLLALPYLYYNVRLYTRKQHLVDVTEIFNQLNWEKKQRLFKLGYLAFLLFITLFWMIYNALEDDEM
ncbi:hypothetical protein R6Q57_023483 [Mikania cordata]